MAAKIYLSVVEAEDGDSIIAQTGEAASEGKPLIRGEDYDENLAFGSCKKVLARNTSTRTLYQRFVTPKRLLVKCTCGAFNVIPSQIAPNVDGLRE